MKVVVFSDFIRNNCLLYPPLHRLMQVQDSVFQTRAYPYIPKVDEARILLAAGADVRAKSPNINHTAAVLGLGCRAV